MSKLTTAFKGGIAALVLAGVASVPAQAVPKVDPEQAAMIRALETKGYATESALAAKTLLVSAADLGERIVAVGQFGHVVLSDDDGATWRQAESVPTQALLTSVYFVNDQVGYAVGHDAVIIKTEDGGENWLLKYSDPEAQMPLFSVKFSDEDTGVAVGAFSTALSTTDGGETWNLASVIPDPPPPLEGLEYEPHLNALFGGPDGLMFIAAETGFVFRSADDGASWEPIKTPYFGSFWGGMTLDDGNILIFGMRGNVWRSEDQGTTWTQVQTGTKKSFGGGIQMDDGTIILAGLNGGVAYSTDGGKTFDVVDRPDRKGYSAIVEGPDGTVLLFGEPGVVSHPDTAAAFNSAS
ncbi:YCF48-related protein [Pyruvatibacter sp.]|uniref:WD40/YVTN/BNR-like repeat-containing protein n=1 Tax=Pyruvatibacter sp. TaxID=1981328 RepID=UPI0032EF3AC1